MLGPGSQAQAATKEGKRVTGNPAAAPRGLSTHTAARILDRAIGEPLQIGAFTLKLEIDPDREPGTWELRSRRSREDRWLAANVWPPQPLLVLSNLGR